MDTTLVLGLVIGLAAMVVLLLAGAAVLVMGGAWFVRGRKPEGRSREEALAGLGYSRVKADQWARSVQGTRMMFDDLADGGRWTVRLPRYNTMTLRVEERDHGSEPAGAFESGHADLDQRFHLGSTMPAQTQALLANGALRSAMCALPALSLDLGADELVVRDPGRRGLSELQGSAPAGSERAVDAELQLHHQVATLVTALFRTLYSASGTVFDEHR